MRLLAVLTVLCFASMASGDNSEPRKEPSKRLLSFLSLYTGFFTNVEEVKDEKLSQPEHDVVNATFKSVYVPALPNEITLLLEEVTHDILYRQELLIIREDDRGVIRVEPHNFTDITKYKFGQFDVTKDFANVRLEDLSPTRPECEHQYKQIDVNIFVGTFPDCNRMVNGVPAKYAFTISCRGLSALVYWSASKEKDSLLPYENHKVSSYPLLPSIAPGAETFLPPCDCQ